MSALPADWTPPPRGIEYVRPAEDGALEILCDCATVTLLTIDIEGALTEPREIAFTCDGCQSVHWLTLTPTGDARKD